MKRLSSLTRGAPPDTLICKWSAAFLIWRDCPDEPRGVGDGNDERTVATQAADGLDRLEVRAFISRVHATAAVLDHRAALVAGALSSDPHKAKESAPAYDIPPERAYGSVDDLIEGERALPADRRIDFVSIATPNFTHFAIAKKAVEAGFNVLCDKPMTFNLYEAEELAATVESSGVGFAVTHNFTATR